MQLNSLYLRDFRNYQESRAALVPGVNLLVGGNANGKTNLLEGIFYLSTGRSFRTRREQELIRFQAEFAELSAEVTAQEREQTLRAVLFSGRRPRQLWLNGVKQKTAAGIAGTLTSVLFCPEDLLVLKKGAAPPAARHDDLPAAAKLRRRAVGISAVARSEIRAAARPL